HPHGRYPRQAAAREAGRRGRVHRDPARRGLPVQGPARRGHRLIQRVRLRLFGLALLVSIISGVAAAAAFRLQSAADALPIAAAVFIAALAIGWAVTAMLRAAVRRAVKAMRDVVRDPSRRIVSDGVPGDELRELTEWINFLAEDADKSHRALARERMRSEEHT